MTELSRYPQSRYVLPSFVERTSYGVKEMNPYNKLFEERIIFLGVQIDDASANDVMAQLLTLEAMKIEHTIMAPGAGTLRAFKVSAGEQVGEGAELVDFLPAASP